MVAGQNFVCEIAQCRVALIRLEKDNSETRVPYPSAVFETFQFRASHAQKPGSCPSLIWFSIKR